MQPTSMHSTRSQHTEYLFGRYLPHPENHVSYEFRSSLNINLLIDLIESATQRRATPLANGNKRASPPRTTGAVKRLKHSESASSLHGSIPAFVHTFEIGYTTRVPDSDNKDPNLYFITEADEALYSECTEQED